MSMDGRTFRRCRVNAGLSQTETAELLEVSQQLVSFWETGARPIPEAVAASILTMDKRHTQLGVRSVGEDAEWVNIHAHDAQIGWTVRVTDNDGEVIEGILRGTQVHDVHRAPYRAMDLSVVTRDGSSIEVVTDFLDALSSMNPMPGPASPATLAQIRQITKDAGLPLSVRQAVVNGFAPFGGAAAAFAKSGGGLTKGSE